MRKINHATALLCVLVSIFVLTSCSKDTKYLYPEELNLEVCKAYTFKIFENNADWTVSVEDQNIATVEIINDSLKVNPLKAGETRFIVSEENKSVIMDCRILINNSYMIYMETQPEIYIELSDTNYKELIEDEVEQLYPFNNSSNLIFIYTSKESGTIHTSTIIQESAGKTTTEKKEGNFSFKDEQLNIVYNDQEKDQYIITKKNLPAPALIDTLYLTRDYTSYFKEKYPEGGVKNVSRSQVWEENW